MAHHRCRHSKKHPRCTICTQHRWRGNAQGRFKEAEEARHRGDPAADGDSWVRAKSPRARWGMNKRLRSARDRLKHLRVELEQYETRERGLRAQAETGRPMTKWTMGRWTRMIIKNLRREIVRCEAVISKCEGVAVEGAETGQKEKGARPPAGSAGR